MPNRARKLYFSVDISIAGATRRTFPLTEGRLNFATGDLYGSLLEDLSPVTRSTQINSKQRNMVAAWFVPLTQKLGNPGGTTKPAVVVDFVAWTAAGRTAVAGMGYTGASGAVIGGATLPGGAVVFTGSAAAALFTRHMAVRVRMANVTTFFMMGMLYVERKHSIEV